LAETPPCNEMVHGLDGRLGLCGDEGSVVVTLSSDHVQARTGGSVADVEAALSAAQYPQTGRRGMCPATRAAGYAMTCPEVQEAFRSLRRAAHAHGTQLMAVPFPDLSAESCRQLVEDGVTVLMHSVDELLFRELCQRIIADLADLQPSAGPSSDGDVQMAASLPERSSV
jgi:hypothetical protein